MSQFKLEKLSGRDVVFALALAFACLLTFWISTAALVGFVGRPADLLDGMWAAISAIFVFRDTSPRSVSAGIDRLIATCVSFAICLPYLWFAPSTPLGMAALVAVGTLIVLGLGRREDIVLVGITTTVVMICAAIDPHKAWSQPILRLTDTVIGVIIGVICKWVTDFMLHEI